MYEHKYPVRLLSLYYDILYPASAMWNFSVLLPLMIGDKIPEDKPLWECHLLLLEIALLS